MSWSKRKQHPSKIVKVGDDVEVTVLGVDSNERRISLGLKQLEPNPWSTIEERYSIGSVVEERMRSWASEHDLVGDVRVMGAMAGMELVRDRKTKTPADTETAQVLALAREKGLILLRAGMHHNVIRTLMPLTIPDDQLDEGLDIIGSALAEVAAGSPK